MRKVIILILSLTLVFSCAATVCATTSGNVIYHTETNLENGLTVIDKVIAYPQLRSDVRTYEYTQEITKSGTTIGVISIKGSFRYDGSTVSVVSKEVTQTDTYDGWNYFQGSFTSSGGTIILSATLTKLLNSSIPFTMTLSCDKDGNITYT